MDLHGPWTVCPRASSVTSLLQGRRSSSRSRSIAAPARTGALRQLTASERSSKKTRNGVQAPWNLLRGASLLCYFICNLFETRPLFMRPLCVWKLDDDQDGL